MRSVATIVLVFSCGVQSSAVFAQTFAPLATILNSDYEASYPFVRCAAFYQANLEWAGKDRIGVERFEQANEAIKTLLAVSALVRSEQIGGGSASITDSVYVDTRKIADLYIERYRNNYAATGQAWASDEVWKSDLKTCKTLTERLKKKISE